MDAVTGQEVQIAVAVLAEQFNAGTALVAHIHVEQFQQAYPLGIHKLGITGTAGNGTLRHEVSPGGSKSKAISLNKQKAKTPNLHKRCFVASGVRKTQSDGDCCYPVARSQFPPLNSLWKGCRHR